LLKTASGKLVDAVIGIFRGWPEAKRAGKLGG